jgi:FtsP/CotA-like multicopper oxidase with cupredoxin domain
MMTATLLLVAHVGLSLPVVRPNDNRRAAGAVANGVLTVRLEAQVALWRPEGSAGPGVPFPVFGEAGKAPSIPGPMIRVRAGTEIRVVIQNSLTRLLCVRGLQDRSAGTIDTVDIAPGATREIRFRANTVGTFYYWGRTTTRPYDGPAPAYSADESELVGAFIVDPPTGPVPAERVLLITSLRDTMTMPGKPRDEREIFGVNGLSWPYSERLHYTVGDTVRWRVINAGQQRHPMHLHGFYFNVLSRGDQARDTIYTPSQTRKVVTEHMLPGTTMTLTWVPTRPGNWLFHCHLIYHIDADLRLGDSPPMDIDGHRAGHAEQDMVGLVMGIRVDPARGMVAQAGDPVARRKLRLFVDERPNVFGDKPGFSFVLQTGSTPPARDSVQFPSSTIVLHRGEPTEILVVNRTRQPSSTHWHGIELESYYDGVAGWSGAADRVAPMLAPGDSFAVRMTPDRAGTFIYHTHSNETVQLSSGLYGALLVLEPGQERDPNDRLFLMGEGGPADDAPPFVNGMATPPPVELRAGQIHRLRLINISTAAAKRVRLRGDSALVQWRAFAKDGADLPPAQATTRPAETYLGPGETIDFEVRRPRAEQLTLEIITGQLIQHIPVIVR